MCPRQCPCCSDHRGLNEKSLGNHLRKAHPGASDVELASAGYARCPVPGCNTPWSLSHHPQLCRSSMYNHLGTMKKKHGADAQAHIDYLEHSSTLQVCRNLLTTCIATAPAGSHGYFFEQESPDTSPPTTASFPTSRPTSTRGRTPATPASQERTPATHPA